MGVPFFKPHSDTERLASVEVSFGRFHLFREKFLLLEDDKPVPLGSRALELLIALLERPGELVTKQELMDRVWPNIFVEPNNLTVNMSALRRALRDGRDGNRFIINIPGRGYKFVASVAATNRQTAPRSPNGQNPPELEKLPQTRSSQDLGRAPYAELRSLARSATLSSEVETWR